MIFNNGVTDSVTTSILNSIEWKIRFGVLQGTCKDSPAFQNVIPDAKNANSGKFYIEASSISGGQKTTIVWYRNERRINLRIVEVTYPH